LLYLETKFAALVSYGLTVELLKEVLPIGQALNTMSLRRQVRHTAGRLEAELGEGQDVFVEDGPEKGVLSSSVTPFIAGLDGVYVHAKGQRSRREGWFEVIVGKSLPAEDRPSKCFGFVSRYDPEPKGRLSAWLDGQRLQQDQPVTFLSDGGDTVRELPRGLIPQAEYLLDWFHVTMRLTGMSRLAQGVREADQPDLSADLEEMLEHLKWNLCPGRWRSWTNWPMRWGWKTAAPSTANCSRPSGHLKATSLPTKPLSPITANGTGKAKSSRRPLWSRPSARWSAGAL
jgi:hypothetical protein